MDQRLCIVDGANDANGVGAQVGADKQRLGLAVADAADGRRALHAVQHVSKAGAEGGTFNAVDLPLKPDLVVIGGHTRAAGAQVGVVVRAEEHVQKTILF